MPSASRPINGSLLSSALNLADLVAPSRCALCDRAGVGVCIGCLTALAPAADLPPPAGLDECRSLLDYEGDTVRLVGALKFHNRRDAVGLLGDVLAALVADLSPDCVTWSPTSRRRRVRRGYDQAELLARTTAGAAGLPVRRLLHRDPGSPQTGSDRAARMAGPSFRPTTRSAEAVLVVDDVRTTGSTLSAAAAALRAGGARRVFGVTLAVVP